MITVTKELREEAGKIIAQNITGYARENFFRETLGNSKLDGELFNLILEQRLSPTGKIALLLAIGGDPMREKLIETFKYEQQESDDFDAEMDREDAVREAEEKGEEIDEDDKPTDFYLCPKDKHLELYKVMLGKMEELIKLRDPSEKATAYLKETMEFVAANKLPPISVPLRQGISPDTFVSLFFWIEHDFGNEYGLGALHDGVRALAQYIEDFS